jgi:ISXO2-like transposase domain
LRKGTVVHADEAAFWDNLHERFKIKRINHQEAYSLDGACTNMAEGYLFRLRRAEIDIDPQIVGAYLSATRARSPSKRRVVVTP